MRHPRSVWPYEDFEVLQAILWAKNIFEPHLTPNIMTSSTGDVIKKPQFLFGLLIYTFMQNFRPIAPVTKEIETKRQKSEILIHYDIIIKQTKKVNKKLKNLIFFIPTQCFLPFVKIPSRSMILVAWRCMPPRLQQVAKSPVLLGLKGWQTLTVVLCIYWVLKMLLRCPICGANF